jgi:hypothetical protein
MSLSARLPISSATVADGRARRRRLSHRYVDTKLGQRRALGRAQQAMAAYQERQDTATAEAPRLHVVA